MKRDSEFELIDRIRTVLPSAGKDIICGIGDDAAVIRVDEKRSIVATVDMLIEGIHFQRNYLSWYELGVRCAAVNLSDLAAMAASPRWGLLSLGVNDTISSEEITELVRGVGDELQRFGAVVIGGNMARHPERMTIDLTLIGEAITDRIVYRSGAKADDLIFITGSPGMAAHGLALLQSSRTDFSEEERMCIQKWQRPEPRVHFAAAIAEYATAMIDTSDGLAADLAHLCQSSSVGAVIEYEKLPHRYSLITDEELLHGGEEYELFFSIPHAKAYIINTLAEMHHVELHQIGNITSSEVLYLQQSNQLTPLSPRGWVHF